MTGLLVFHTTNIPEDYWHPVVFLVGEKDGFGEKSKAAGRYLCIFGGGWWHLRFLRENYLRTLRVQQHPGCNRRCQ